MTRTPGPHPFGWSSLELDRRRLLKGALLGAAALSSGGLLTACGSDDSGSGGGGGEGGGVVSIGSNASDATPKAAYQAMFDQFTSDNADYTTKVNTVDHNTFQEQINNYLQGKPDDVFTWFAGNRMNFFAQQGLAGDISDVWEDVDMSEAFKKASTGEDGKQYFIPVYNYPWAVFYRPSLFEEKGYTVPKTLDEYKALGTQMKADGLTPIGFADKDGWPAMGTFDILNMRINGFEFHQNLLAGEEAWDSKEVKEVFSTWAELLPLHEENALGRTWQEAAQNLVAKKSGTYLLGSFLGQQFEEADREDLDFFPFPEVNPEHGTDSIDAPIDGFMMSAEPENEAGAKALLRFLATPAAQDIYLKSDPNNVGTANGVSTEGYNALQKKAAELIGSTDNIAQFLDRDTRPDFASPVVIPALQQFLQDPKDIDGVTKSLQQQAKSIFVD
ncbi:MAG: ABC transporter, substrate-binding protein (cluster 1, maltose/g3p/polyamine/iron) [uncultured Frankineae bacterium]|uniref:ABC transporter, substrate-binding protein (Cluster 1, maltose/g3p/polyamine/iron) n=1 Tax=uncultured Frankineae bacterium TaxID=437475 RepID=A0A6J4KTR3_9ACTN|nr:MAG: ABC transporter, substrate-binding protein (cluster 1, maltose/g3p/polyamine/iron) [uncultured Frankineae bacterium]